MKHIKPYVALIIVIVMVFSFSGCIKIDFSKFKKEEPTTSDTVNYNTDVYNNLPSDGSIDTATLPSDTQAESVVTPVSVKLRPYQKVWFFTQTIYERRMFYKKTKRLMYLFLFN